MSNLPRTSEHPTLKTLLEIAEICWLTLEGAHRLFGYDLEAIRDFDLRLNGGRTHIFESYPFNRDLPVDLPARLASHESFGVDASLRDLVLEWQKETPIRVIEEDGWKKPGAFYVHVGTEDSLGSSIPPGAMALVEPIGENEKALPNPRAIYLLQFANGYRCSHCVVTRGTLRLFSTERAYFAREEFAYPGAVRIAGRVRMFAINLPVPDHPSLRPLPHAARGADLILPWEHVTRDSLLATKRRRFKRSKEEKEFIQQFLRTELQAKLSERSERRYRSDTSSDPHVNALLHLTLANVARYTDALRTGGSWFSDRGRFSLETLLNATSLEEASDADRNAHLPTPVDVWEARRKEFGEWPPLLSIKFPQLQRWDDRVIRLSQGGGIKDLDPAIGPGSWLLLERVSSIPDTRREGRRYGWSRPIYVLRKGLEMICGHLARDGDQFALLADRVGEVKQTFRIDSLAQLNRVSGIAVPV
ncbi:hypothetical protein [Acidicapsa dinghuensis]|uniref:hypothetical protein n=1 Tax=Acidicapsa dinghuensis TaxID=2218256 RepID=UPI0021E0845C|nr:hypothetical protein [Acidicapsa dinghuensis]